MLQPITQAFIFAAGRGERMRPITDKIPKPLIRLQGKPIIDYTIEKLLKLPTIEKIIINGFYLADQMQQHLKELNNPKIIFSNESQKFETGGGLVFAKDKIDLNRPLLCLNGDVAWHDYNSSNDSQASDLSLICQKWQELQPEILLGLTKTKNYFGYEGNEFGGGDFDLVGNSLFKRDNCALSHAFVGTQVINPKILEKAPSECFSMSHFYKAAREISGRLNGILGIELAGRYFHIGNPQNLSIAEQEF